MIFLEKNPKALSLCQQRNEEKQMLHAIILVCSVKCYYISDNWGPYNSIDQCLLRTDQMHIASKNIFPKYKSASSYCTTTKFMTKGDNA